MEVPVVARKTHVVFEELRVHTVLSRRDGPRVRGLVPMAKGIREGHRRFGEIMKAPDHVLRKFLGKKKRGARAKYPRDEVIREYRKTPTPRTPLLAATPAPAS